MEISGKELARPMRLQIKQKIEELKRRGIVPKIAIITLGNEEAWKAYVGQKIKFADEFGIEKELVNLQSVESLYEKVKGLNQDRSIHGIIVQRPLSPSISREKLNNLISKRKDIDGFRHDSEHEVPVWLAVKRILEEALLRSDLKSYSRQGEAMLSEALTNWLKNKQVIVVGKGESAGQLIIEGIIKLGISPTIIDSKTKNRDLILKNADIIISSVGKRVVSGKNLKQGVILVGVGIQREDGVLQGDYDEDEIKNIASFYTPTPGGVGPLNLTYLFLNLINSIS